MISLTKLKDFLKVKNNSQDAVLAALEKAAVSWFEGETHRYWGTVKEAVEVVRGTDRVELWLREVPIEITRVAYRSYPGGTEEEIFPNDVEGFELREGDPRVYRKGGSIWCSEYEFVFEYSRGFTSDDDGDQMGTPADVRLAVMNLVRLANAQREVSGNSGIQSEKFSDYSYTLASAASSETKEVEFILSTVNHYRRRFV